MKKKALSIIYTALCLLLCVVPFAGMLVAPTNQPLGNEVATEPPAFKTEENKINEDYLKDLGDYFSTHFAFRPQFVDLDAKIQAKLFGNSNLSSVVVGKDGYLFYSSTLDNYLGRNVMNEREIFNIVNNLEITQSFLSQKGVKFLFTVAPNKNTLYGENMPYYYSKKESEKRNLNLFKSAVKNSSVLYCDLEELFKSKDEVLYFKRDSHWNEKGALLAYDKILDTIGKPHNDYKNAKVQRSKTFIGDLAKMIYPFKSLPELCYNYDINQSYTYITPTKSVEEAMIITDNPNESGSLYMYRDSFGNSLLPFFANAYNKAYFTKMFPINLELDIAEQNSDTVIFEIAERNLAWFAENPPVLPSPEIDLPELESADINFKNKKAQISNVNMGYVCISGELEGKVLTNNSKLCVNITDCNGDGHLFEAFTTQNDNTDFGFTAYIPVSLINGETVDVCPVIKNNNNYYSAKGLTLKVEQPKF